MNPPLTKRLPMWHFFERIEKELGYVRSIDKYKQFLSVLAEGWIPIDENWASLRRFSAGAARRRAG